MKKVFPKNFLWGAATASHQVEGGTDNQWTRWEKAHKNALAEAARERYKHLENIGKYPKEAENTENYISGRGVEHYERYKQDFQLLRKMNMNAFRFGIEWSRVEPEEGEFSEKEINHYRNYIKELKKHGIEPFPTLWHWSEPDWFSRSGGFSKKKNIKFFVRFARKIGEEYGPDLNYILTINEPNVYVALAYVDKDFPLKQRNLLKAFTTYKNLATAHSDASKEIRKVSEAKVGLAANITDNNPFRKNNIFDKSSAKFADYAWNWWFLNRIEEDLDFIGLNYYHTNYLRGRKLHNPGKPTNDLGWYMEPAGVGRVLKRAWQRYELPIIITENGLADSRDRYRKWWLEKTVSSMEDAIKEGVELFGYLHWSLLDNFEWRDGWWPKFGLVEVDRQSDMKRTLRPSGEWFGLQIKEYREL